jgi:4'-phosphopantetheinyl transferase
MKTNTITSLENGLRVALIRVDEIPAAGTFLSVGELEKLAALKIEKRRRDWLGGRYAAKTLIKEILAPKTGLSEIEITYDPFGRPVWNDRLLSITHSGPFCAAACGSPETKFLGIDLEKAEPRADAWYEDYFHKGELASHNQELATLLWTRKEALFKALGLGLKADLLDINLSGDKPEFARTALARYIELGSPAFTLNTLAPELGYYLSTVCEKFNYTSD